MNKIELIIKILVEHKAINIVSFDVKTTSIADNIIIASGTSNRHIKSLSEYLLKALKEYGVKNIMIEGLENSDWVLIDTGDEIVHLLSTEIREFYDLEGIFKNIFEQKNYS